MGDHALFSYPPSPVAVHNAHSHSVANRPTTADPRYAQPLHRSVWPTPSPPSPPSFTPSTSSYREARPMTAPSLVSSASDAPFLSFSNTAPPTSAGLAPPPSTSSSSVNTPHFSQNMYPYALPPLTDPAAASHLWDYQNSAGSYTSYAHSRPSDVHLHPRPMTADSYSLPTSAAAFYSASRPLGLADQPKKRARRRYDEIERMYACNYQGCSKAYGTLNHLNAHISMQKHGPKRLPHEFKEIRKEYRARKKAEEAAHRRRAVNVAAAAAAASRPISANPADSVSAIGLGVPYAFTHQLQPSQQQMSQQMSQQMPQSIPHSIPPPSLPQSIAVQSMASQPPRVQSSDFSSLSYTGNDVSAAFYAANNLVQNHHPSSMTQQQLPNINTAYSSATTPSSITTPTPNSANPSNKLKLDSHHQHPTDFSLDPSSPAKMDHPSSTSISLPISADSASTFNPLKMDPLEHSHDSTQFAALTRDSHTWPGSA